MRRERHARITGIHDSYKHVGAGLDAIGLWAMCLSLTADKQYDGWVSEDYVYTLTPSTRRDRDARSVVPRCVRFGLLEAMPADTTRDVIVSQSEQESGVRGGRELQVTIGPYPVDGFYIHDFLDVNLSQAELADLRAKRRRAGAKGGKSRAGASAGAKQVLSNRPDNAQATEDGNGNGNGERETIGLSEREDVEGLCTLLADLIERNGSNRPTVTKAWRDAARLLLDRDGRPLDEARALIEWSQQDEFWRTNVLSMPTFRKQYDQLRLKRQGAQGGARGERKAPEPSAARRLREAWARQHLPHLPTDYVATVVGLAESGGTPVTELDPADIEAELRRRYPHLFEEQAA